MHPFCLQEGGFFLNQGSPHRAVIISSPFFLWLREKTNRFQAARATSKRRQTIKQFS